VRTPVTVGVVGPASWAVEVAGLLAEVPQAELCWVHDPAGHMEMVRALLGSGRIAPTLDAALGDEALDAVILGGMPSSDRTELARAVLGADKHLLLSSPLASSRGEAQELVALARRRRLRLALAHGFPFSPAMIKLRQLLVDGELGELYYLDVVHRDPSSRGTASDVLSRLGPEQLALVSHLLGDEAVDVNVRGESYVVRGVVDVAHLSMRFATGISAQIRLSWLGHASSYRLVAVGAERTAVVESGRGDRALEIHRADGTVLVPRLGKDRSLELACASFLTFAPGQKDDAEVEEAGRLVRLVEALHLSLDEHHESHPAEAGSAPVVVALPTR
jgi:predicted dehydrogenase